MPRYQVGVYHKDDGKVASLATGWAEVSRETALDQLSKILDSLQFRSSKRCSIFLRHIVEHATENRIDSLKERSLGVEVFGRDPKYDTNQDPVVRSTAGEVRKRLAQYYLEAGHRDEIRISLPPGSYSPEIHPSPERFLPPVMPIQVVPRKRWRRWMAVTGAAVVAILSVTVFAFTRKTDLDRFWGPLVEPSAPVVIVVGQPRAYRLTSSAVQEMETWAKNGSNSDKSSVRHSIEASDIFPVWDRDIALVDAQAMLPLSQLLSRKGKKVEIRGARVSSLADLRGKACIFVGAFNNDWTLRLTTDLRFHFELGPTNDYGVIRDRQDASRKDWAGPRGWPAPADLTADYGIVTRAFNPTIEQTVVSVAGASGFGTYAAGEFLTNEEYFAEALRGAPRDWYRKNMQVVLSVKVISGIPGPPRVLATHFW